VIAPAPAMDSRAALRQAMTTLRAAEVASHTLAAELLLMHVLGRDRAWIYTHPEDTLEPAAIERYFALVARRAAGEPTQYLTGKQEFWGLEFEVTPAVLIPRPETEHVVEVALERLGARGLKINMTTGLPSPPLHIADPRIFLGRRWKSRSATRAGTASAIAFSSCKRICSSQ
jgi:methylase of polypeptide subunit release factors